VGGSLATATIQLSPSYLHTQLVLAADGHKLSKQNGAAAIDVSDPPARLREALRRLGVPVHTGAQTVAELLSAAARQWPTASSRLQP